MKRVAYCVYDLYGCESGCDGHRAYLELEGNLIETEWGFDFPYRGDDFDKWAIDFCKGFWPDCEVDLTKCNVSRG